MREFPAIADLPDIMSDEGWTWERSKSFPSDFWLAHDAAGGPWLVKFHGGFYSLREHAFGGLAQRLGISCQSSVLLRLTKDSQARQKSDDLEESQIALVLLDEHPQRLCSDGCSLRPLEEAVNAQAGDRVAAMQASGVRNAEDWVRADMMAYLCGANEPSDRLITKNHDFVVIDSEQMFSTRPTDLHDCDWFHSANGDRSNRAMELAGELCASFAELTDAEITSFCAVPPTYKVEELWSLPIRMHEARDAARLYVKTGFSPQ